MAFNTGNPLGSTDPRDLSDNSENFDRFANGTDPAYNDRFGNSRKSFAGMEQDFQQFLLNSGYVGTGPDGAFEDYDTDGPLTITALNQIFTKDGEFYRAKADLTLPYVTTGTWIGDDETRFVSVGDAALRQELSSNATGQGSDRVAYTGTGETVTEALDYNRASFQNRGIVSPYDYGAGDAGVSDYGPILRSAVSACPVGGRVVMPAIEMSCSLGANNSVIFIDKSIEIEVPIGCSIKVGDGAQSLQTEGEIITNQGPAKDLDDLSIGSGSSFTGTAVTEYYIEIDGGGSPNTFRWSKDNGQTFVASGVPITGGEQALDEGVTIQFGATTGHNVGSLWYILYDGPDSHVIRIGSEVTDVDTVRVFGAGKLDGNKQNNINPSFLAIEISSGVLCDGNVDGVSVEGVRIENVGGRSTMCRASTGKTVNDVRIYKTKSRNCDGGHLGGHPEYAGSVTNWRVITNDILGCREACVEPNFNCTNFEVSDNYIDDFETAGIHMWRGPKEGTVNNNRIFALTTGVFGILASTPGGFPEADEIDVTDNKVYGTQTASGNAIRLEGDRITADSNKMYDVGNEGLVMLASEGNVNGNEVFTCQKRGLVLRSDKLIAKGNTVWDAGQNGATRAAIEVELSSVAYVQGNTALNPSATAPDYGVWTAASVGGGYLVNNMVQSNQFNIAGLLNNGGQTAADNYL